MSTNLAESDQAIRSTAFQVNGRTYRPPARPIAVVCVDGCADEYLSVCLVRGLMPNLAVMAAGGYRGLMRGALPSFTNVNNAALVTGAPPAVTGISGNFFLDRDTGAQVMMNDGSYLRCPTILAAAADAGRKVAMITAKEKLRDLLSRGMRGHAFSAEKADHVPGLGDVPAMVGRPRPDIYSGDASIFVLQAGVELIRRGLADFAYLSLTDFIQHKHAPESPGALDFYAQIDEQLGQLLALGAIVAVTADHGMNAKHHADGSPRVIYLQSLLDAKFGGGVEVVCPITDPYVLHHGALGSLVMIHVADLSRLPEIQRYIFELDGVTEVYEREVAAHKLELPADRIGDLVVMSGRDVALGRRESDHDLSLLKGGLRTHGGRYEEMVPFVISEPLNAEYAALAAGDPRNFDIFAFACNGVMV